MDKIYTEYKISISDFRKAFYFGLFIRMKKPLRIAVVIFATIIIYMIAGTLLNGSFNYGILFLGAAEIAWLLFLFGGAEKNIRAYIKSPTQLLETKYETTIYENNIFFSIPSRNLKFETNIRKVSCIFEISELFLIYVNLRDVYILPKRAFTDEEVVTLRNNFHKKLGDNFSSRFLRQR